MFEKKLLNNKWFTLVELLVVITIISIITSTWVWYFGGFLDKQQLNSELLTFSDKIRELDYKVKRREIFDYKLNLSLHNSWSLLYTYYENIYDTEFKQELKIDNFSWSWELTSNWWGLDIWQSNLYISDKLFREEFFTWTWKDLFMYDSYAKYYIGWYLSWEVINDITVNYFSETNLDRVKEDYLILAKITEYENQSGASYTWISIENINNKKYVKDHNWVIINTDIYLFFERNSSDNFIKITKN